MEKYNTLGSRIKELRQSLSLSQVELAQQLHCTQAALSQYESGSREPGLQELVKIATALQTSTDYLLGLTHIKSIDADIKKIGDYLGLSEESIKILRDFYWEHKRKTTKDYLENEVKGYSDYVPGDEAYEQDFSDMLQFRQQDLDDYLKFINKFICSSAFKIMSHCLCNNLFVERTIYDVLRVAVKRYDEIESALFETTNEAEKAYCLIEDSEDYIQKYSLNIFDAQTAVLDFCKDFTRLEVIKELDYKESFYKKIRFNIYHHTRPMFESNDFSVKKLNEALTEDVFQVNTKIIELLKDMG